MTISSARKDAAPRRGWADILALVALALAVLVVYSQVLLTNRTPSQSFEKANWECPSRGVFRDCGER